MAICQFALFFRDQNREKQQNDLSYLFIHDENMNRTNSVKRKFYRSIKRFDFSLLCEWKRLKMWYLNNSDDCLRFHEKFYEILRKKNRWYNQANNQTTLIATCLSYGFSMINRENYFLPEINAGECVFKAHPEHMNIILSFIWFVISEFRPHNMVKQRSRFKNLFN